MKRSIVNKTNENSDLSSKLSSTKSKNNSAEIEYTKLREENTIVIKENKLIK